MKPKIAFFYSQWDQHRLIRQCACLWMQWKLTNPRSILYCSCGNMGEQNVCPVSLMGVIPSSPSSSTYYFVLLMYSCKKPLLQLQTLLLSFVLDSIWLETKLYEQLYNVILNYSTEFIQLSSTLFKICKFWVICNKE